MQRLNLFHFHFQSFNHQLNTGPPLVSGTISWLIQVSRCQSVSKCLSAAVSTKKKFSQQNTSCNLDWVKRGNRFISHWHTLQLYHQKIVIKCLQPSYPWVVLTDSIKLIVHRPTWSRKAIAACNFLTISWYLSSFLWLFFDLLDPYRNQTIEKRIIELKKKMPPYDWFAV